MMPEPGIEHLRHEVVMNTRDGNEHKRETDSLGKKLSNNL